MITAAIVAYLIFSYTLGYFCVRTIVEKWNKDYDQFDFLIWAMSPMIWPMHLALMDFSIYKTFGKWMSKFLNWFFRKGK
jgi:hypothetical protein